MNYGITRAFSLALLFTFGSTLHAAKLENRNEMLTLSTEFIEQVAQEKTEKAYRNIQRYAIASDAEFGSILEQALKQSKLIETELGRSTGHALIRKETIGNAFERHTWLIKYQKAALVWQITYYQAEEGWQVMAINFNADVEPLYTTLP